MENDITREKYYQLAEEILQGRYEGGGIVWRLYKYMIRHPFSIMKILSRNDFALAKLYFGEYEVWTGATVATGMRGTPRWIFDFVELQKRSVIGRVRYLKEDFKLR